MNKPQGINPLEQSSPRFAGVYKITCHATGDTYVGASRNIAVRFRQILNAPPNRNFRALLEVQPKSSFSVEVLQQCRFSEEFNDAECFWIRALKPSLNVIGGGSRHFCGTTVKLR